MSKICFFNTAVAWGGGEKWHFEVSHHLHSKGHDILVIAHVNSVLFQKLKQTDVPCLGIELSNLSFLNPLKHKTITSILKKGGFHSIVMNMSRDIKIGGLCAKKAKIQRIIYRRGSAIPIKNTFLNRYLFKNIITEVLANSEATKKMVLARNAQLFALGKIKVIYNGIDVDSMQNQINPKDSSIKKEIILLNLGRLEHQKNQRFLIHLSKELKNRELPHKLLIGGKGRLKEHLESLIKELGLAEQVDLSGFIDNPLQFIQLADIFVLPSLWEGFGYVLAEASLCKKPIIAFDISSNPELVIDGKTGFLVPINDMNEFSDKIQYLYQNPEQIKKMGEAGFEYIKLHFDKKEQIKKIEDYLING